MAEITRPETSSSTAAAAPVTNVTGDDDQLGHLYKMSTTAGLGSQEYVAINTLAVLGVILGIASVLAIMANVLLVIPLVGFIFSAVAFRQIEASNGTQTGKWLAVLGIFLSMGFVGFVGTRQATEASRTKSDRQAIANVVAALSDRMKSGKVEEAYALFTNRFQARVSLQDFGKRMKPISENTYYGKLKAVDTNGLANFINDPASGSHFAEATIIFRFERNENANSMVATFYRGPEGWLIDDIPDFFPAKTGQ